ncbi:hypothetical protein ACEQ8H_001051 [Pleosporales sp. CAS-2024a]
MMQPSSSLLRAFAFACPSPILSRARTRRPLRPLRRPLRPLRRPLPTCRFESTSPAPKQTTSTTAPDSRLERDQVPSYELTFTCNVCSTRSSHRLSKQGYHHGTVLITCPDCKNRHLISDHLKIFSDKSVTIEDLLREKGDLVKKGSLSPDGDVEFWDDGSSTPRSAHFHPESKPKGDQRLVEQPASKSQPSNRND